MGILASFGAIIALAPVQIDPHQHNCLSMNIYHESRSEPIEGQIAVAQVTLNRVSHSDWPDTICDVVHEPKQFSWTHTIADPTPKEGKAWEIATILARDVMIGNVNDPTMGAVFYHANYVNPKWADFVDMSKVIGNHIFYTWDGDWNADN